MSQTPEQDDRDELVQAEYGREARLAAAAPDLLAALKDATRDIPPPSEGLMCHVGIVAMDACARCQRAAHIYAAIAKAEGR